MIDIVKGAVGTQYWVRRRYPGETKWLYLESFDDEIKALRFVEELRKVDNDRLLTLQEEAVQAAERSSKLDEEREEEVWRGKTP